MSSSTSSSIPPPIPTQNNRQHVRRLQDPATRFHRFGAQRECLSSFFPPSCSPQRELPRCDTRNRPGPIPATAHTFTVLFNTSQSLSLTNSIRHDPVKASPGADTQKNSSPRSPFSVPPAVSASPSLSSSSSTPALLSLLSTTSVAPLVRSIALQLVAQVS